MADKRVIRCGFSRTRRKVPEGELSLNLRGDNANLSLEMADITSKMATGLTDRLWDLLEIATYVYGADQAVSRGGDTGADLGKSWRRRFKFVVAVREPAFWAQEEVCNLLASALNFVSEDEYEFKFEQLKDRPPEIELLPLDTTASDWYDVDDVISFSGGLDSFAGAAQEILQHRRRIALVSHRAATKIDPKQRNLVDELRQRCRRAGIEATIHHFPVWVRKDSSLDREHSQRTRSFLFAALAATIARLLQRPRFRFFENGVVSFNLPVCGQVVGTRATRTTHPQTLVRFSRFFSKVFDEKFEIDNPFVWKTKTEIIRIIEENGCASSIQNTVSCSHTIEMTTEHSHCGVCSQCIDRRFGVLAAGLEDCEPESIYKVPLFTGVRTGTEEITMLESYVSRARELKRMSWQSFLAKYGEVFRIVPALPGSADENAQRIYELYRRHSGEISSVLESGVAKYRTEIVEGRVPDRSLLSLVIGHPLTAAPEEKSPKSAERVSQRAVKPKKKRSPKSIDSQVVRILHISDSHFAVNTAWEQDHVLRGLAQDVAGLVKGGLRPDLIVWTGDIAQSGSGEEYGVAEKWINDQLLPNAMVDSEALILVPGNHDVERRRVKAPAQTLQEGILKRANQEHIAELLREPDSRKILLDRHTNWIEFVNRVQRKSEPLSTPWYREVRQIRGLRIHIAAFCSSWMSWTKDEQGRLLLSRFQAYEVLKESEQADIVIAAMHHPWDFFAEFDASNVKEEIRRRCDVVLRGHLHHKDGRLEMRPDGHSMEIASGAIYAGSEYGNSYQLIEIDPGARQVRVHLRVWDNHNWISDKNAYRGQVPDGIAKYPWVKGLQSRKT